MAHTHLKKKILAYGSQRQEGHAGSEVSPDYRARLSLNQKVNIKKMIFNYKKEQALPGF